MLRKSNTRGILSMLFLLCFIQLFSQQNDTTAWSVEMDDIVVTAQFAPTHSKNALHKVKTINVANIRNRGIVNLEKLLEHELNIRLSQDMILGSSINLQGMSGQNVKVMVDGVPVIGRVGDNIDISQISLYNVERVEIIEGPLSVNYGTNALGGVINIITKKSQLDKYDFNLNSNLESTSDKSLDLSLGLRILPKLLLRLEGNYYEFDGFNAFPPVEEEYLRTFQWNPKVKKNIGALLRYNFGEDGKAVVKGSYFNEEVENAGVIKRPKFKPYAFDEYYLTDRLDHSFFIESGIKEDFYFKSTLAHNNFKRQKHVLRKDFESDTSTHIAQQQDTSIFNAYVFRPVIASKFTDKAINFQVGADINFEEGFGKKIYDEAFEEGSYSAIGDYALFGSLKYHPVDALDLQLGLRIARNSKFKAPLVPSFNFKYNPLKGVVFRGSYAKGFRAPTLKELYLYFVDSNHYILGNPDLEPELSDNFQLSMDWDIMSEPNLTFSVSAFYNDIKDKIDLYDFVEVDGEYVPAAELGKSTTDFTYFNQDRFRSMGLNTGINFNWRQLKSSLGIAPIGRHNQLPESVKNVDPFTFVVESNAEVSYTFPEKDLSLQFYIKHNNKLVRYYIDVDEEGNSFTNQSTYDGYYLADFSLSKKIWERRIHLNLGVKNIFDVKNINFSDIDAGGAIDNEGNFPVAKGRTWHAGIIIHLSGN